jgi:predicted dehydrogenase
MSHNNIWLIGLGNMGYEYSRVLDSIEVNYTAIGRSEKSTSLFSEKTGHEAISGGIEEFLKRKPQLPDAAIVAVNFEYLKDTAHELLNYGIKHILIEKPGVQDFDEIDEICNLTLKYNAKVMIAYNRRFYASVIKAREITKEDGGVTSFHFEFTEWTNKLFGLYSHKIESLKTLFLTNSSHVVDTAFYLGGTPERISCYHAGTLEWHKPSIFAGAGITKEGALFSYNANWQSAGRWSVEIMTPKHRLHLRPMEKLMIQNIDSIATNEADIDPNNYDTDFKPGLYLQTKTFLEGDYSQFCSVFDQKRHFDTFYKPISGYKHTI